MRKRIRGNSGPILKDTGDMLNAFKAEKEVVDLTSGDLAAAKLLNETDGYKVHAHNTGISSNTRSGEIPIRKVAPAQGEDPPDDVKRRIKASFISAFISKLA